MNRKTKLLIGAGIVTVAWILICGLYFAKSITGTGDSGAAGEGRSYLVKKNWFEQVMVFSSLISVIALIAAFILDKKKWLSVTWSNYIKAIALWIILANFFAYCLGAVVYELIVKK